MTHLDALPTLGHTLSRETHEAIGQGIEAYALVEGAQIVLLRNILKTEWKSAAIIFSLITNLRSRCEVIDALLHSQYKGRFNRYWASCSKYLGKLATFRNAIAHWHPYTEIYANDAGDKLAFRQVLGHPVPGKLFQNLTENDFPAFIEDCGYIRDQLMDLSNYLVTAKRSAALPERFQRELDRQNAALLRQLQIPRG